MKHVQHVKMVPTGMTHSVCVTASGFASHPTSVVTLVWSHLGNFIYVENFLKVSILFLYNKKNDISRDYMHFFPLPSSPSAPSCHNLRQNYTFIRSHNTITSEHADMKHKC